MSNTDDNQTMLGKSTLALDVGFARVGVAISRKNLKISVPLVTIPYKNSDKEVIKIILKEKIEHLVIGLPLNESNELTEQALSILKFARRVLRRFSIKIYFVDEYASSKEAEEMLKFHNGDIDSISAMIILERFLAGSVLSESLYGKYLE